MVFIREGVVDLLGTKISSKVVAWEGSVIEVLYLMAKVSSAFNWEVHEEVFIKGC